jgi:hypothetical protein
VATRTDEEPPDPISLPLEHVVETVLITTHRAHAYLIYELVLMNLFLHDVTMSVLIINPFHFGERLLAIEGFKEMD